MPPNIATVLDSELDIVLIPTHPSGSPSQFNPLHSSPALTPPCERDIESTTGSSRRGPRGAHDGRVLEVDDDTVRVTDTLLWQGALEFFTVYGALSVAFTPEEFALVCMRLQQEWTFDAGLLMGIAAINAAIFAINPDSICKVDTYACTAVSISSIASGLGIACDVWFLLRYGWVEMGTFISRSRDIYGSYVFFSLSSRMPTLCTLISSISLTSFLGLIAYDARPIGVLVIGALVALVMILQFVVYGTHRCATSDLRVWRAGILRFI